MVAYSEPKPVMLRRRKFPFVALALTFLAMAVAVVGGVALMKVWPALLESVFAARQPTTANLTRETNTPDAAALKLAQEKMAQAMMLSANVEKPEPRPVAPTAAARFTSKPAVVAAVPAAASAVPAALAKPRSAPSTATTTATAAAASTAAVPAPVVPMHDAPIPPSQAVKATPAIAASEVITLMKRAHQLIQSGDISAARSVLERAMEGDDPASAFALAETYDPNALASWGVVGVESDVTKARALYSQALKGGVEEARHSLQALE
jgi:hypothetical protein